MSIRNDTYTVYKEKEYRVWDCDGYARLISHDAEDLQNGFTERDPEEHLNPRIFFKMVSPEEIGDVYSVKTFCLYHGYEFFICRETDDTYTLGADRTISYDPLIDKFNFERVDKYGYEKKVRKEDVDLVYEKKELLPHYFDD